MCDLPKPPKCSWKSPEANPSRHPYYFKSKTQILEMACEALQFRPQSGTIYTAPSRFSARQPLAALEIFDASMLSTGPLCKPWHPVVFYLVKSEVFHSWPHRCLPWCLDWPGLPVLPSGIYYIFPPRAPITSLTSHWPEQVIGPSPMPVGVGV